MAIRLARAGHYVALRWTDRLTVQDADEGRRLIEATSRAEGRPVVYVSIVPPGVPFPPAPVRAAVLRAAATLRDRFSAIHLVIEGEGVMAAVVRMGAAGVIASGVSSVARLVKVHSGLDALRLHLLRAAPAERALFEALLRDVAPVDAGHRGAGASA